MPAKNTLETDRLLLRPFQRKDAAVVQRILTHPQVVATLLDSPHPVEIPDAKLWIRLEQALRRRGERFGFGVVLKEEKRLIGGIDIELQTEHKRGDIAYWLHPEFWGRGLVTEAAARVLIYGFEELQLHRIYAQCMQSNSASARVLEKIGLVREAVLRQHHLKDGEWVDIVMYGLTRATEPDSREST
ncbi:MAG: GNAT family protein [Anaerolineae bacterium]